MHQGSRLLRAAVYGIAAAGLAAAMPAHAALINPVFDSSITGNVNAAAIESAFQNAAAAYGSLLPNPVVINIRVSWGSVDGYAMPGSALGASIDPLYGYFSYSQVKSWLRSAASTSVDSTVLANLPGTPASGSRYVLPSAEAKALGLISGTGAAYDGYIGFGTGVAYDFAPGNGITAGTYDFTAVAAHEIDEVLGRISGLTSSTPSYATPFDLFRCGSTGARNFSYSATSYFSINGCKTRLGQFNNVGSGDRSDWASASTGTDVQDAYLYPGVKMGLSDADMIGLDAIGWGDAVSNPMALSPSTLVVVGLSGIPAPEPAGLAVLGVALAGFAAARRVRA